jgi:flagellar hook-associated protein 1 FlgK
MESTDPLYMPQLNRENTPGQIGQGVDAMSVERIKDELLEGRIVAKANEKGYWNARDKYIMQLEKIYNEPGEYSIRAAMDKFWKGWQELSINPSEIAARQSVLERGNTLMDSIHHRYDALRKTRDMVETEVTAGVEKINTIIADIASLNEKIVKVKAMGDNPNDYLDRRDLLVNELSEIINITVDNRDADEFNVHTGGLQLVQGRVANYLSAVVDPQNEGYSRVIWKSNGENAYFTGGSLAAHLELRDKDIREEIQKIDLMTINFIDNVNSLHRKGWGANAETGIDFFKEYPFVVSAEGNYDRNGDGVFDSSYIFRIGGSNVLSGQELIGINGEMTLSGADGNVVIEYYPTDTVQDVIDRINNSPARVGATLDTDGRLILRAMTSSTIESPDFVIKHLQDSGEFLAGYAGVLSGSGADNAYDWETADAVNTLAENSSFSVAPLMHPSGWIEINRTIIADPRNIAAGFGDNGYPANPGDGSAALAIASLRNKQLMIGKFTSFDNYFASVVADIGLKGEKAEIASGTINLEMQGLEEAKKAISGVNLDEEFAQMIKFQHGYAATARFISQTNEMLDIVVNRLKLS